MNAGQAEDEESWKRDIERQVRLEMEDKKRKEQAARQIELDREEQERIREEAKQKIAREFALQQAALPRPAPAPAPAPMPVPMMQTPASPPVPARTAPMLDEAE